MVRENVRGCVAGRTSRRFVSVAGHFITNQTTTSHSEYTWNQGSLPPFLRFHAQLSRHLRDFDEQCYGFFSSIERGREKRKYHEKWHWAVAFCGHSPGGGGEKTYTRFFPVFIGQAANKARAPKRSTGSGKARRLDHPGKGNCTLLPLYT